MFEALSISTFPSELYFWNVLSLCDCMFYYGKRYNKLVLIALGLFKVPFIDLFEIILFCSLKISAYF